MKYAFVLAMLLLANISYAEKAEACETALSRTSMIINQLINDLNQHYPHSGGGGISKIEQVATDHFVISIAQEEGIDQIHYQVTMNQACQLKIIKKSESSISFAE